MERLSGPQGTGKKFYHRRIWRCVFLACLLTPLLAVAALISPDHAFALQHTPSKNVFAVSPTQGPVGAVIRVNGSGVFFSDGTQINLGYTSDYHTCNIVSGGQAGVARGGAFSGWFRWPAGTGTGTFGVCGTTGSFTFQIGSYQVLSASAPRVSVAPTIPQAGKQATVSGANFLPGGSSVSLVWRSSSGAQSVSLGTVVSNSAGAFSQTFTVPARASTGSYTVTGIVGSGSPPVMNAFTTFHVEGVTLVAVPTPTITTDPTVVSTTAASPTVIKTTTPHYTAPVQPTASDFASRMSLLLPLAFGGIGLIVLALLVGVVVVRRQRTLAAAPDPNSGPLLWPEAADTLPGGVNNGPGAFTPWPGAMYPGGNSPSGTPGMEYAPFASSPPPVPPVARSRITAPIPFDPGLLEAMREAQVSLFATPRPPVSEEIEAQ